MTPLDALYRCQRAWERSQPQLFFELWPDGLDDPHEPCRPDAGQRVEAVRIVEPVVPPVRLPGGGLNAGAEPCRDLLGTDGESALITAAPPAWSASAPLINQTGAGRAHPQGTSDQRQEVEV